MIKKDYSAGAVKFAFWFMKFRQMIGLLNEGKSFKEIKELNEKDNIFGISTPARRKQMFSTVSARIKALGKSIYPVFVSCDLTNQRMICLAATMAHDTLFFEFVYEVIRNKIKTGENQYTDADLRVFFNDKQIQSEKAAAWTEATLTRLGRTYKTQLFEAGFTDKGMKVRTITPPLLDLTFVDWLKDNDFKPILAAFNGD